ncbi:uncharacterized protein TRAVEDRAFT_117256, partial [Trametes versicolor FP-101664 SS1]|uniref:uncharacterized protein n=1 Tax=Trametes versicolor (strain FP-101664) TaxID=717944 RepID=UPI0004622A0D
MAAEPGNLLDYVATAGDGLHLEATVRGRYKEDTFFQTILDNPRQHKNFTIDNGLVYLKDGGRTLLCVPHIIVNGRNVREIVIAHAHSLLAHLGMSKTVSLLRDHVWWK